MIAGTVCKLPKELVGRLHFLTGPVQNGPTFDDKPAPHPTPGTGTASSSATGTCWASSAPSPSVPSFSSRSRLMRPPNDSVLHRDRSGTFAHGLQRARHRPARCLHTNRSARRRSEAPGPPASDATAALNIIAFRPTMVADLWKEAQTAPYTFVRSWSCQPAPPLELHQGRLELRQGGPLRT